MAFRGGLRMQRVLEDFLGGIENLLGDNKIEVLYKSRFQGLTVQY